MKEEHLLTGALEPTNQWYAVAKIAGIKMAQAYRRQYGFDAISLMPTNLYGPGDNFSIEGSHVLPALIRRIHEAKVAGAPEVVIWGTGTPMREFLHVDDLAAATLFLMDHYSGEEIVNIGTGTDVTIADLEKELRSIYESRKDKTMFIAGAETLRYRDIIEVIDAAKGAGVEKVGIVTAAS